MREVNETRWNGHPSLNKMVCRENHIMMQSFSSSAALWNPISANVAGPFFLGGAFAGGADTAGAAAGDTGPDVFMRPVGADGAGDVPPTGGSDSERLYR